MGEKDSIITQNRSIAFNNNPYKYIDKGGNRAVQPPKEGGYCKPPSSTPSQNNGKGKPADLRVKLPNPNDFSFQNRLDQASKATDPVKEFMRLCPQGVKQPKDVDQKQSDINDKIFANIKPDPSIEFTKKIIEYFVGFKYRIVAKDHINSFETPSYLPIYGEIGNVQELVIDEQGDSSKLISFEGTIRSDKLYLSSGKVIFNLGDLSLDINIGLDKNGPSLNYNDGITINSIGVITNLSKFQIVGLEIENQRDENTNYTYVGANGYAVIAIYMFL